MKVQNRDAVASRASDHFEERRNYIREKYNQIAGLRERWITRNSYFYNKLGDFLRFIVEAKKQVLLVRSELGQFLDILQPLKATGIDVSEKMVEQAKQRYAHHEFLCAEPETVELTKTYDYVIFYTIGEIIDIQKAFLNVSKYIAGDGRLIVINYNYLWRPIVVLAEMLKLKIPQPVQNWLNVPTIENFLCLSGYEVIKEYDQILMPVRIPLISWLFNSVISKLPLIKKLCFVQVIVARKIGCAPGGEGYSVSVIVPCKNERDNIESAVMRIPDMGKGTEIIFCDDKSEDGTPEEIKKAIEKNPDKDIKLVHGPGICKALNVWTGFDAAKGDILMILDADLTVIPEELTYFYDALATGRGEFINGTRMIYFMEKDAMRFLNIIGNKFFSMLFSYILGQRITDTLCGTKVFFRKDWHRIRGFIGSWDISDRWGDYELLFGAAKLHMKILEVPVHYVERVYGETKMKKRFLNGLIMLRMSFAAFRKFKFV